MTFKRRRGRERRGGEEKNFTTERDDFSPPTTFFLGKKGRPIKALRGRKKILLNVWAVIMGSRGMQEGILGRSI